MKGMTLYYVSRAIITALFCFLLSATGMAWWLAALMGALVFGLFLWAPHSGRYSVHPELGVTALRRDERTQGINDKAGRNAFIAVMLALAGLVLCFGMQGNVPASFVWYVLLLGLLVYYLSDFWLRKAK